MHEELDRAPRRYAVVFREAGGLAVVGGLEVTDEALLLSGRRGEERRELTVRHDRIIGVRIGRAPADRLNGYRTVLLERVALPAVQVAPLEVTCLHEIADLLGALASEGSASGEQLALIVPIKPECFEQARELIRQGPPFDPASLGLTGHQVYLHGSETIFVFSGPNVRARVRQALRGPALWRAGMAWQDCVAGRPRLTEASGELLTGATPVFTWTA